MDLGTHGIVNLSLAERLGEGLKESSNFFRMARIYAKEAFWAEINEQDIETRFELEVLKNPPLYDFYLKAKNNHNPMTISNYFSGAIGFWSRPLYAFGFSVVSGKLFED